MSCSLKRAGVLEEQQEAVTSLELLDVLLLLLLRSAWLLLCLLQKHEHQIYTDPNCCYKRACARARRLIMSMLTTLR